MTPSALLNRLYSRGRDDDQREVRRRLPFRIHVVQTDNGAEFQSDFHWHLEAQDIRHVYIRPWTSHLNGKVGRSHRVDDQEFYQLLDQNGISDDIHLFNDKLCARGSGWQAASGEFARRWTLLNLFPPFTYFLHNPEHAVQFGQAERRIP